MSAARLIFDDKERVGIWVAARVGQLSSWGDYYAMGAERGGELVAGIVFNNMTDSNAMCHIAVSRRTKLLSSLLDHAYDYGFNVCNLLRLTVPVEDWNTKSMRLVRHIGFVDEGVMRKAGTGGCDVNLLVLWPGNYRKGKHHGQE